MDPSYDPVKRVRRLLRRLHRDSRGATAVEYGLILAFIVIAVIGAVQELAHTTTSLWNNVSDKVQKAH